MGCYRTRKITADRLEHKHYDTRLERRAARWWHACLFPAAWLPSACASARDICPITETGKQPFLAAKKRSIRRG
jgi:hypothetical protein